MQDFLAILALPFMQRAVVAGLLIAVVSAVLGVFVVQRRLSFLGDGLAHAAFGGVALGSLLGLYQPLWIALIFTLIVALGIAWVRDHTGLSSDTAIGIFFAVSVSLGVIFVSKTEGYQVDAWHLLFGSILGVGKEELTLIAVLTPLSLLLLGAMWNKLAYITFDQELAAADGLHTRYLEYLLFALAAVIIVVSVRVIGAILIAAYLVIPAATARLLSRSLLQMTLWSVALGVLGTLIGLGLSYWFNVPSGSAIILSQAGFFIVAALLRQTA